MANESSRDGVQVVQVYAHLVNREGLASDEPEQKLVGYTRVAVGANATAETLITLDRDAYRTWDVNASAWTQWSGAVELRIGTSSRHIAQRVRLSL